VQQYLLEKLKKSSMLRIDSSAKMWKCPKAKPQLSEIEKGTTKQ